MTYPAEVVEILRREFDAQFGSWVSIARPDYTEGQFRDAATASWEVWKGYPTPMLGVSKNASRRMDT